MTKTPIPSSWSYPIFYLLYLAISLGLTALALKVGLMLSKIKPKSLPRLFLMLWLAGFIGVLLLFVFLILLILITLPIPPSEKTAGSNIGLIALTSVIVLSVLAMYAIDILLLTRFLKFDKKQSKKLSAAMALIASPYLILWLAQFVTLALVL
jgi:hypothetical protein